uniref:Uncharacterized protein n=1 Tax=Ditylenchus dipsaci TaxID=166011 RepID=A0A915E5F2_9BILA
MGGKRSSKSRKRTATEASVSKLMPTSTYMDEESQYTLEDQKKDGKQSGSSSSSSNKGRICMTVLSWYCCSV